MLAVGDKLGKLKVYCYPVCLEKQSFKSIEGHSSNVKSVEFLENSNFLITIGEVDNSIIIWSY